MTITQQMQQEVCCLARVLYFQARSLQAAQDSPIFGAVCVVSLPAVP